MLVDHVGPEYTEAMERLSKAKELVVDVETTGLRVFHNDRICGIAVLGADTAAYFPFRHEVGPNLPMERMEDFRRLVRGKKLVNHNIKFDIEAMWADGFDIPDQVEDDMLAAHLMNENEYDRDEQGRPVRLSGGKLKTNYKLKSLSDRYLESGSSHQEQELIDLLKSMGLGKGSMWKLPPGKVAPYAVQDVHLARGLRDFYRPHLESWKLYDLWQEVNRYAIETAKMEIRGLLLDQHRIQEYMAEAEAMVEPTKAKLQELAGYAINPASPKQLQAWLGLDSTAKDILEDELALLEEDHPRRVAIQTLLDYRGWSKVSGTYYEPYLHQWCDGDGVIHPNLSLIGTVAGRLSAFDPNLQAVPRYTKVYKVKDVFIARPGYVLVSADYSQAEIRWGSHYAREERMAANLLAGLDIHSITAETLKIPRDAAKRINFGIIYGIGKRSLSEGLRIPEEQAASYLNKYHGMYPGFRSLYRRAEGMASDRGYIRMFTGRVRRYDAYNPTHKASSNLIQGAVAEMMRLAILRLARETLPGLGVHMLLQVHDQILFEVPEDRVIESMAAIREGMENFQPGLELMVPMKVDIKYGPSWGNMVEWKAA